MLLFIKEAAIDRLLGRQENFRWDNSTRHEEVSQVSNIQLQNFFFRGGIQS